MLRLRTMLGTGLLMSLAACGSDHSDTAATTTTPAATAAATGVYDSALAFNKDGYTTINVTIDGVQTPVRWYKEVCYVGKPIEMAGTQSGLRGTTTISNTKCGYQSMNIFVPESAANDQDTAIYFAVNNAGWMASYVTASVADGATFNSSTSNVGAALKAGYVYIDVASRSRGITAADGSYPGKAPAAVVDAKAAVRYLRLNDAAMPGNANHIVVNGTSGGGALSSILGASGNSADYYPYLAEIGAAGIDKDGKSTLHDDVLAINAYCPITDLGNADLHYEWLFNVLGTRAAVDATSGTYPGVAGSNTNPTGSASLMNAFVTYQNSLGLKNYDGTALTASTMLANVQDELIRSAETYMAAGGTIPALGATATYTSNGPSGSSSFSYTNDWISVDSASKTVLSLDIQKYLKFLATQSKLKPTPAFDQTGLTIATSTVAGGNGGETNLFGTSAQKYSNFTEYGWNNNDTAGDGVGKDDTGYAWADYPSRQALLTQTKLINPMAYIGTDSTTAPYWYIRVGTRDRDTSVTVSMNLSRALKADSKVTDLNYHLAWDQPHAGNYDVPEAMAWIQQTLAAAKAKGL
ncbi:hypothetical protein BTH42_29580 [Burkholderia sp. SRS-W-2-2016]|uniref:subtype B tannase n=1 Tax=Burkholderia sp. SRS-W-2-2016 TaxID=1926878 RepID=UPI00094B3F23|nr:subtype B tannase [Burkholderia sp. SRS-W-2-2016]OLL28123.1 hypothetical protein BTH42_29580 [Burkholderia sp. SRS-W-2-2016]